jgi:hypothetical protein
MLRATASEEGTRARAIEALVVLERAPRNAGDNALCAVASAMLTVLYSSLAFLYEAGAGFAFAWEG